jgi:hypothetical protein
LRPPRGAETPSEDLERTPLQRREIIASRPFAVRLRIGLHATAGWRVGPFAVLAETIARFSGTIPAARSYPNDSKEDRIRSGRKEEVIMKSIIITLIVAMLPASGTILAEEPERIGVYDSRAIAIAWAGTEIFKSELSDLRRRHAEAEESGDTELASKLESQGRKSQEQLHRQGFSTAPVDGILARFQEPIAAAMEEAGVDLIVSKWDEETLARYASAEQVDITMELVLAMEPDERQLGFVRRMGDKPPIPLEKLDKKLARGHE